MVRLTLIICAVARTNVAGIEAVIFLSAIMATAQNIFAAAALGAVLPLPLAWLFAKKIAQ